MRHCHHAATAVGLAMLPLPLLSRLLFSCYRTTAATTTATPNAAAAPAIRVITVIDAVSAAAAAAAAFLLTSRDCFESAL